MKIGNYTVLKRGDYVYVFRTSERNKVAKNKLAARSLRRKKSWGQTKYFKHINKYLNTPKKKRR